MTLGKSFINEVTDPVERTLRSCALRDPTLGLNASEKGEHLDPGDTSPLANVDCYFVQVLYRRLPASNDKVILLSGGGSGHEPAHAGYLGEGALDVIVAGDIFASPSAPQVLAGLQATHSPRGTLMIVKNYTGDKLNFGLAAEKARTNSQDVNMVVVGDDVSVEGNALVGQRGLAGVVFVHKVAGAMAAKGADLNEVTAVARKTATQMATVAASVDRCNVPGRVKQKPLPQDQLEYGMGIHNEPGVKREAIPSLEATVHEVLAMMYKPKPTMWYPRPGQKVALMVNNLGGLSELELGVISGEILQQLAKRDVDIAISLVGTFVTSLDGPGFSVTLLQLDGSLMELLHAPTTAPAWPRLVQGLTPTAGLDLSHDTAASANREQCERHAGIIVSSTVLQKVIHAVASAVADDEPKITEYDTLAGDGDCGQTLLNGVNGLVNEFQGLGSDSLDIAEFFRRTAATVERSMGGTSGAIYAIFLNALSNSLVEVGTASQDPKASNVIRQSLPCAVDALCQYTPARVGHRTLMDALIPFVRTFEQPGSSLTQAVLQAQAGTESTRKMTAALGRASYVGQDRFDDEGGIPDPGAVGVMSILNGIQKALRESGASR